MTAAPAGALAKIARAEVHLQALDDKIREFLQENPYSMLLEPYGKCIEQQTTQPLGPVFYAARDSSQRMHSLPASTITAPDRLISKVRIRAREIQEHPTTDWGVLIGDVVHNLRSALDHLVFDLTSIKHTPPHPFPASGQWRRVEFPITLDANEWSDHARRKLWGLSKRQRARIERLQPFRRRHDRRIRQDPRRHPLYTLHELWNADKHRTLHLTASQLGFHSLDVGSPLWQSLGLPPLQARIIYRRALGPFERGTELARIEFLDTISENAMNMHMKMNLLFNFGVAFEEGPPAYGRGVVQTLERLLNHVAAILAGFESEFR
jgi:hypothetical protein